jgi:hypothetical integral membrane protein (TIGR02206 family)
MRESILHYMNHYERFTQWNASHWWALSVSLLLIVLVPLAAKKFLTTRQQNITGALIGGTIAGSWILWTILEVAAGTFDIRQHLPLQLCRFSNIAIVLVLVFKKQWWYEILYFWALGGMLQASITPDLQHEYPHFMFFRFWIGHPGMILAIVYATVVYGMRPQPRHILKAMLALNVFLLAALATNLTLDTNYLFLSAKPATPSILDYLGPWPWYLLGAEFVALANFSAAYVPWIFIDRKPARKSET